MKIITRKEAKELGLKRYFTGKPCKHGHVTERRLCNGHCCACEAGHCRKYYEKNKEKAADRDRKYYERNKKKIAEHGRKYREKNKEKVAEKDRKYREENKEKTTESRRRYYEQNKEIIAERERKYREKNKEKRLEKNRKYYEQNTEKCVESTRKWQKSNPEHMFIRRSLNRIQDNWKGGRAEAEKLHGYTCEQLKQHIESQFKEGMSWENRSEWHFDHIKPVSAFLKEGINDPAIINALDNLQPLWAQENLSKHAKWDGE